MNRSSRNRHWSAVLLLAATLGLSVPLRADAIQLNFSCEQAALAITSGVQSLEFNVVGQTVGTAGMLGDLLCFVGDRRCSCFRNATEGDSPVSSQFAREVGRILASCLSSAPNRSLSGVSQQAVIAVCP